MNDQIDNTTDSASEGVPEPLIGLPRLMKMAFDGEDLMPLGAQLLERAQRRADDANALMDFSTLLQLRGQRDLALTMQAEALNSQRIYHRAPAAGQAGIRLLAIMGPGDLMANTPLEFLVENSDVALDMLYVAPWLPFPATVPVHDVAFVAVGESAENISLLQEIDLYCREWPRPLLNRPGLIACLSRDGVCTLLESAPGIVAPNTIRADRATLEQAAHEERSLADLLGDGDYPVIVRPVGSHAGQGLAKADTPAQLADYLAQAAGEAFYLARFVDYRSTDGRFRKYRIVLIDGRPYAGHMAISADWIVHYLNADMLESPSNRAQEAAFMADFDQAFAVRHAIALRAIAERTGLDYLVIDCAETPDGRLLIFEIDTSAVIHAMDPEDVFPYKHVQMKKVFSAFRNMLGSRRQ